MALIGKISRLNADLRNEVCLRLYNGETSADILPYLNARKDVRSVLQNHFNGEDITPQNLSAWKGGEYQKWLSRRQQVQDTIELSKYATQLAQKGQNLAAGAAAIVSGKVLEVLDELESAADDPERLLNLCDAIKGLHAGEVASAKLRNDEERLRQNAEKLTLEKNRFRRQTAEMFIEFVQNEEAKRVALGGESKNIKLDKLVTLMFGERPSSIGPKYE